MQKIKPEDFPDEASAKIEANRLQKAWLAEPKPEFGGKMPLEAILEERAQLGNPEKRVEFSVSINRVDSGAEIEAKAEKLFYSGLDHLQNGNPKKAADIFLEYLELGPTNHVVWHNLGIAYLLQKDVKQAIPCLEKAIKLKPDYDLAKKNLQMARTMSYQEIEKMAREYRVKLLNEGKVETMDFN
jgi:tetratricopeptide (TPR) repeat protein